MNLRSACRTLNDEYPCWKKRSGDRLLRNPDMTAALTDRQVLVPQALAHHPLDHDAHLNLCIQAALIVPAGELVAPPLA